MSTASVSIDRQNILREIVDEHRLDALDIYLLPFIPLIEMIWADERRQQAEIDLLLDFARRWLQTLRQDADGEIVVDTARARRFIERFLRERPSADLLKRLRSLAIDVLHLQSDAARRARDKQSVYDYCLDIAAAAVATYPYAPRARVNEREKELLLELCRALGLEHCAG